MGAVTKLLSRLDRVRQVGAGRWVARCPAHDDRSPSLSIRETGDSRVLVHCHAGCDAFDVLQAIGLQFSDLYDDPWVAAREAAHNPGRKSRAREDRFSDPLEVERLVL